VVSYLSPPSTYATECTNLQLLLNTNRNWNEILESKIIVFSSEIIQTIFGFILSLRFKIIFYYCFIIYSIYTNMTCASTRDDNNNMWNFSKNLIVYSIRSFCRHVQLLGNGQQHLHYDGADHVQQPQRVFPPFRYPSRNDVLIIV